MYVLESKESKLRRGVEQDKVVELVDCILHKAITQKASDIHLEPFNNSMRVRYRIDGMLHKQEDIDSEQSLPVISRLKVLAALDIAQKRIPQDGKLMIRFHSENESNDREIDLRISTFPSIYGEKMVIRILDRIAQYVSLESLGCRDEILQDIISLMNRPYGFFLVTGPTGSGKSTTLYAMLSKLNIPEKNIVTMEDPVEYHIDGIMQSQINEKIDFTFERGLRSLLRQDPDIMMVGEIRDKETAQIAIEAALTGHLVFSTLHTNNAVSTITRLIDMGIEPFLITAALSGVLAQRLVRMLCEKCKEKRELNEREKELVLRYGWNVKHTYQAKGCRDCFDCGYRGRIALFEFLKIDESVCDMIMHDSTIDEIQKYAVGNGMTLLSGDGVEKVNRGIISLEELLRVVAV